MNALYAARLFPEAHALAESLLRAVEQSDGGDSSRIYEARELVVDCTFPLHHRPDPSTCEVIRGAVLYRERTASGDSTNLLHALQLAARCAQRSGDVAAAIGLQQRAASIQEKAHGADSYDLSVILNNLASMLSDAGRVREMQATMERALAIRAKLRKPDDPAVLLLRNNLAVAYQAAGDQAAALPLFEDVVAGYERTLGATHPKTGYALNNLAEALVATGERRRARRLFERALAVRETTRALLPFEIAETMTALGELLFAEGDTTQAEALFRRAVSMQSADVRPDHPFRITAMLDLADVDRARGNNAEARRTAGEALEAVEHGQGPDHPEVARVMVALAGIALDDGAPAEAAAAARRAIEILHRSFGSDHPDLAGPYRLLARALESLDDGGAFFAALEAERVTRINLRHAFRTLPERQALAMRARAAGGIDLVLSALLKRAVDDSSVAMAWDAVVRSRGIVLDEMASRVHMSAQRDTSLARLVDSFTATQRYAVSLALRGPRDAAPRDYRDQLDRAWSDADAAEAALARASAFYRADAARREAGIVDIVGSLSSGTALVAYVRYQPERGEAAYGAFIRSGSTIEFRGLGAAHAIDSLVTRWHATVRRAGSEAAYRRAATSLRRKVWDPIEPRVAGSAQVLVVPDGALSLVNLATLPVGDHAYLLERGPTIQYLTTERDLLVRSERPAGTDRLLAVGGVDYNASAHARVALARGPVAVTRSGGAPIDPCASLESLSFGELLQSRSEIDDVRARWAAARPGGIALALTGSAATEQAFRLQAPLARMLHLATHGYFIDGPCPVSASDTAADEEPLPPLVRSGLALAGANARGHMPVSEDDGLLTAAEISSLDLSAVDWVVLSGCDTGLGSIVDHEGLFGLRRAFQVAGAGTIVMSLWSVEDAPTRRWMRDLYKTRLTDGRGPADAVRDASLALLRAQRSGGLGGHPWAWGAFVACGAAR